MIKIVAQNVVKEGMREAFIEAVQFLITESQKEEGCVEYHLYEDVHNPQVLTFLEVWKDLEAIDVHSHSEHYTTIVPTLGAFVDESDVKLYKVL